ncbi:hypothetical protein Clacol_003658 [Clathrus columnatus]|uniref:Septin-type G domain-containing protein n=1 Tax=Clathrus columnatus TaxID=1419009 RepID=A0AAV5A449_9AGAM|nr:hypothetical protein Clacol_003658 [Clathrus columnatus]
MLKRPRVPSSPLPKDDSLLSIPIDTPALFPRSKRPRTHGPIIDSKERELTFPLSDDEGEENIYETVIDNGSNNMRTKEYEHVNHFLHELHTECQTRTRRDAAFSMVLPASECAGAGGSRHNSIHTHTPFSPVIYSATSKETLSFGEYSNQLIQTGDNYQQVLDEERSFVNHNYEDNNSAFKYARKLGKYRQIEPNKTPSSSSVLVARKMSDYSASYAPPEHSIHTFSTEQANGYHDEKSTSPQPAHGLSAVVRKKLMGYVGFANLPNQVHRKSIRKGFQFTVMVVGESGLGKSTLINTLFNTTLYSPKEALPPHAERPQTVSIQSISADIEENGVRLRLTVVDTPGFGDFVNNDDSWKPIVEDIESRFDAYLEQESRVNRQKIVDNRVHACLYFIQPTGHSLKQIDIEFMRRLHQKVNLIPIIAKADTLTDEEITEFKQRILADIAHHKINIFQAPVYENEDEETMAEHEEIVSKIPFAVVGSNSEVKTPDGRIVRGRAYPWGLIEVDNEDHCDFVKLRQMLVRTYMEELREHTNTYLYEQWRSEKLLSMGIAQDPTVFKEVNPAQKAAEERSLHEQKLAKMENEMKMVFHQKVQEKEAKLRQSEEELYARHKEMKEALDKQRLDLEEKKRRVETGRPLSPSQDKSGVGTVNLSLYILFLYVKLQPLRKKEDFYAINFHPSWVNISPHSHSFGPFPTCIFVADVPTVLPDLESIWTILVPT